MNFQLKVCPKRACISTVGVRKDLFNRDPDKVLITDFFGGVRPTKILSDPIDIEFTAQNILTEEIVNIPVENPKPSYKFPSQFVSELFE